MSGRLGGKVALITGAGAVGPGWGNGRATAVLFAREGARVVALDRDTAAAEATRQIIESEGHACAVETADVTDSSQIERVVATVREHWGALHVLVNNVGGSVPGGPVELSEEDWAAQLDVNLTSAFLATKCVLPVMEAQGAGAIVNISSVAGLRFIGNHHAAYAAAKAGLVQFTKAVAVQYAARGVRCNSISVGLMHTPAGGGAARRPVRRGRPGGPGREAPRPGAHGPHGLRLGRGPCGALPRLRRGRIRDRGRSGRGRRPHREMRLRARPRRP